MMGIGKAPRAGGLAARYDTMTGTFAAARAEEEGAGEVEAGWEDCQRPPQVDQAP